MTSSNYLQRCWAKVKSWRLTIFTLIGLYLLLVFLYEYEKIRSLIFSSQSDLKFSDQSTELRMHIHRYLRPKQASENITLDIHLEHPLHGHTGEVKGQDHVHASSGRIKIAIGGGITSNKLKNVTAGNIPQKFQFFYTLLPSFCKTASPGYEYHFYLAYDHNDPVFNQEALLHAFQLHFQNLTSRQCPQDIASYLAMHFVQCSHHQKPAWAQNDAMMEAYLDNIDYFYRINDDTALQTGKWTEAFIGQLDKYRPPRVGVVGPKHKGGNMAILTYDFTHRTHVEIFGFYYPRFFTDWYADDWVTKVYLPDHSSKMQDVRVLHTMKLGQRYRTNWSVRSGVGGKIKADQDVLNRYLRYRSQYPAPPVADGSKVISMSLYGQLTKYTWGAIRNAQIVPVFFPGWVLRIYLPDPSHAELAVPARIVSTLTSLGAQLAFVNASTQQVHPSQWRYLVADDPSVQVFLIRDADSRLTDRDAAAVNLWQNNWQPFHCIRDHLNHTAQALVDGLWGARTKPLRQLLGAPMAQLLQMDPHAVLSILPQKPPTGEVHFLGDLLWPLVQDYALCHDSVSCNMWLNAQSFPVTRTSPLEYVGQEYTIHHDPVSKAAIPEVPSCTGAQPAVASMPKHIHLPSPTQLRAGAQVPVSSILVNVTSLRMNSSVTHVSNLTSVLNHA